jgi:outer membrane protein OmpA-like peptidoglycan-associated protein
MKQFLYTTLFFLTFHFQVFSQMEHLLMNMDYVPQSSFANPAIKPKTKFHFGVGMYGGTALPLSYNDIVSKKTNDTVYINGNNILNNLNQNNFFQGGFIPDITLGVGIKKGYFMVGVRENVSINVSAPYDIFEFLIKGNATAAKIGQEQKIGDFRISAMHYREYFASGSYQILPKWQVGLRLKYLVGFENISTQKSDISITTDPNTYAMTLKGQYQINSSGLTKNHLDKYENSPFFHTQNTGFGVDLGAIYQHSDKLKLSASVNDLGFISWKENNKTIKNKNANNSYTFEGIDLYNLSSNNNSNYIDNLVDSIRERFDFEETSNTQSYSTGLNTRMMLTGAYKPIKNIEVGGVLGMQVLNNVLLPSISAFSRFDVFKILQLQVNYQVNQTSFTNLGLGLAANLGPIQYYLMSDNALGSSFAPLSTKNVNVRTGINVQWSYGKDKKPNFKNKKKVVEEEIKGDTIRIGSSKLDKNVDTNSKIKKDSTIFESNQKVNVSKKEAVNINPESRFVIFENNKSEINPLYYPVLNSYLDSLTNQPTKKLVAYVYSSNANIEENPKIGFLRNQAVSNYYKEKGMELQRVYLIIRNGKLPDLGVSEKFVKELENCVEFQMK